MWQTAMREWAGATQERPAAMREWAGAIQELMAAMLEGAGGGVMRQRPEYDGKVIGENLRRFRKAKGYTVEDIRRYLCLGSVQAVYKYENGSSYPAADTMFALMELYGVDLYDVTGRVRPTPEADPEWLIRMKRGQGVDICCVLGGQPDLILARYAALYDPTRLKTYQNMLICKNH